MLGFGKVPEFLADYIFAGLSRRDATRSVPSHCGVNRNPVGSKGEKKYAPFFTLLIPAELINFPSPLVTT